MAKKHWKLHLVIGVPGEPPWIVYDSSKYDLLIEAETEDEARKIADGYFKQEVLFEINHPFLSREFSTCREL